MGGGGALSRRGYRISWRGGGVKTFTSTPPPLDIVRVTSSALRKIEKHPHSWTFTSTPLGHCPCDVIHIPREGGGWSVPVTHTLHRFSVSGQVPGGGGGDHPCHPPRIRHCYPKPKSWAKQRPSVRPIIIMRFWRQSPTIMCHNVFVTLCYRDSLQF